MDNKAIGRSPNYYIKQRLLKNKLAMAGLSIILLASVAAMLGYLIMPDSSPDANDGAVQIKKKPPGFKVRILRIRKNFNVEKMSFLGKAIKGQENPYYIIPVADYEIAGDSVIYREYGKEEKRQHMHLVQVVYPLYIGDSELIEGQDNFRREHNRILYVDNKGKLRETSVEATLEKFRRDHIVERTYWLGTDRAGRDILSRLIYGARISLSIGLVAVIISMVLGVGLGALAGFFGGKADAIILWFMSVVWSIPGIMLVIAISLALQSRGVWVAFVAVGLTMWVDVARVVRGQIFSIKQKSYIEAAQALGYGNFRIVYTHIMPNIMGPLIVMAAANFAAAILLEAGLSFLGLSVQPPTPSWGSMIFEGFNVLGTRNSWHLVLFPGLAISLMVLSFNLLGNGLRDAIDPKTVSRT